MIRKGNIKDLEVITEYNYNLALETEDVHLNREILRLGVGAALTDENKGCYYVYEIEGKVAGQLMITKEWSDWRNGEFWWIMSVYVHKDFRRQGIFKKLYNHVFSMVSQNINICGLRLYVEKKNEKAMRTYKNLGMMETRYLLYETVKE